MLNFVPGNFDESHRTHDDWIKNSDGSFTLHGDTSLYTLERALGIDIVCPDPNIDTAAGVIMQQLGRLPTENEQVEFPEFAAMIKKMTRNKIQTVIVWLKPRTEVEKTENIF